MRYLSFRASFLALIAISSGGCVSLQAIEPVIEPPAQFRFATVASIEFVSPLAVGLRCAERGAKMLGLPALNSGACADQTLITMIDPCLTLSAGLYGRSLCARRDEAASRKTPQVGSKFRPELTPIEIGYDRNAPAGTSQHDLPSRITVEFVPAAEIDEHCTASTPKSEGAATLSCFSGSVVFLANPCDLYGQGWYERTLCHELGHVNGWLPDHSGGRPSPQLRLAAESPEAVAYRQAH